MRPSRRLLIYAGIAIFAQAVFGCGSKAASVPGGGSGGNPVIVHSYKEYVAEHQKAAEFAAEPLRKFGDGEPLTGAEKSDLAEAGKIYDALYDYRPIEPLPKFLGGQVCEALGDHDGAISRLNTFITGVSLARPSDLLKVNVADAHWTMADALSAEGKWPEAMDQVTISLKAYPDTCEYLVTRANIEWNTGKQSEAKKDVVAGLKLEPTNTRGHELEKAWKVK